MKAVKKSVFSLLAILFVLASLSQPVFSQAEKCATMTVHRDHLSQDPQLGVRRSQIEDEMRAWIAANPNNRSGGGAPVVTIPVVVHVVWVAPVENISDAQILSQMDVLNRDYRRLNADTLKTRSIFDSLAADIEIEFCLASRDPQGNPTTGITRKQGNPVFFGFPVNFFDPLTDNVKFDSTGGKDAWPTDQYLNLWVAPLFTGLLGYAQFPGDNPLTDGVAITPTAFGDTGTIAFPSIAGRTATHEIGHWLDLRHIWGDGDCTMDDFVMDTPNADNSNNNSCTNGQNTCIDVPVDLPDMIENYMDYSEDTCMNLFTLGQKARIMAALFTQRAGLLTSLGCQVVVSSEVDFNNLENEIQIYPNPSTGHIKVTQANKIKALEVFDLQGRLIRQSEGAELDLSESSPGIYFVRVITERGNFSRKVVLN